MSEEDQIGGNDPIQREIEEQEARLKELREERRRMKNAKHLLEQLEKRHARNHRKIEDELATTIRSIAVEWRKLTVGEKDNRSLISEVSRAVDDAAEKATSVNSEYRDEKKRITKGTLLEHGREDR